MIRPMRDRAKRSFFQVGAVGQANVYFIQPHPTVQEHDLYCDYCVELVLYL